jgi:hypothetical protein
MAAKRPVKSAARRKKPSALIWSVVGVVVLAAGVLAINLTSRARRVYLETNQVKGAVQEAIKRQEMVSKSPARKEFSPAFLQMAFGDNPLLLEQIKEQLSKALGGNTELASGEVALMLVTYRAEGELRDVAIHIFGNLNLEGLPKFSTEGYWKTQLPDEFWSMGQSALSLLGRDVLVLARDDVEKRQRAILDGVLNNRYAVVQDFLEEPVSFIAVIPEPSVLFTERFKPFMAAALIKGKISKDEMRAEMVALSLDQGRAQELAQVISDMRLMAMGIARLRFPGPEAERAIEQFARAQIRAEGPTVVMRGMLPGETIEKGLPKFIQGLSKGIGRIRRGPGYPS